MDGEINYESDISESWSLIDINLNEELFPAAESSSKLQNNLSSKLKNENIRKINEIELEDSLKKFKEINKTEFTERSNSDSSFKNQELGNCNTSELDMVDSYTMSLSLNSNEKNDSGDAESIEILHMDENYQDSEIDRLDLSGIDQLEFPTYHSDDEESSEERNKNESMSNSSTVIKRKRRRTNRNSEDVVNSINSESRQVKNNLKTYTNDIEKEHKNFSDGANKTNVHAVYKHYRNNVANTVLSLSMCVIFAGVACIAIGHFLGVQNAADTAMELMETLKKLQMENSALQSRLFHINKALVTQEMNHKSELPLSQPPGKSRITQFKPSETKDTDLNNAALSEIRSCLNSIEWLSKIQSFVRKNNKETETENELDFRAFGKFIHDNLCVLNNKKEEGTERLENSDKLRKVSKVLKKLINLVSTSKDNIEKFYQRLNKLKDKLNHILGRILLDTSMETKQERLKQENKVPVTERDLQKIQWNPKNDIQGNSEQEYPESIAFYKFPQPEEYYKMERDLKSIREMQSEVTNSYGIISKNDFEKPDKEKKNIKKYKQKNFIERKKEKKNCKREKSKEKKFAGSKRDKRKKLTVNILDRVVEEGEKINKMYDAMMDSRHVKYRIRRGPINETNSLSKKSPKPKGKDLKFKRRFKKMKISKLKKFVLPKLKKNFYLKKNQFSRISSIPQCFNLTGYWIFKWADGREEYRRYQSLGEWQFERAKARKEVRGVELYDNWQFERAKARKELRDEDYNENWQFKRASARESNRNDVRSHRGKYTKYFGKEFFQERFSWI